MSSENKSRRPARNSAKIKMVLLFLIFGLVIGTMLAYLYFDRNNANLQTLWLVVPFLLIVALMIPVLRQVRRAAASNLPVDDEMSRAIKNRAGAIAYYVSIYIWLAIGVFEDLLPKDVSVASGLAILLSAVVFLVSLIVLDRRAKRARPV